MHPGIAADRWRMVIAIKNLRSLSVAAIAEIDPSSIPAIAIAAIVAIVPVVFPYDRCDCWALFSAIVAIVTIIWKPGLRTLNLEFAFITITACVVSKFGVLLNVPWIICWVSRALHAWHAVCKEVLIGWWHRRSADFLSVILVCTACLAFVMRCCVRLSVLFLVFCPFRGVSCLAGLYHRLLLFGAALLTGGWPQRGQSLEYYQMFRELFVECRVPCTRDTLCVRRCWLGDDIGGRLTSCLLF